MTRGAGSTATSGRTEVRSLESQSDESGSTTSIAANGVTKNVSVHGVDVPEIDSLIGKVRALSIKAFTNHVHKW